jgi:hypothetical protein
LTVGGANLSPVVGDSCVVLTKIILRSNTEELTSGLG